MGRYNTGLIYTNDSCIGCNKCVSACHILGANISVIKNGEPVYEVDPKRCIHCGKCIKTCVHNARQYHDDSEVFLDALSKNEDISLLVDPSFYFILGPYANQILGYLKSLGVKQIFDISYGAEISVWGHIQFLMANSDKTNPLRPFIANTCSSTINHIEVYEPDLIHYLIPVQSPMMCTAIYVKKYLGNKDKLAYIGPCIAKKDEISSSMVPGYVNYSLSIEGIRSKCNQKATDEQIKEYSAESDLTGTGFGSIMCGAGGLKEVISYFFPRTEIFEEYHTLNDTTINHLKDTIHANNPNAKPTLVEITPCDNSCMSGPGVDPSHFQFDWVYALYQEKRKEALAKLYTKQSVHEERYQKLCEMFKDLNYSDFTREYDIRYRQPFKIPESTIEDCYKILLKDTPEKRNINCRSCGYSSCSEMATAIAYGFNKKENCIHYMKDAMFILYNTDPQTGILNRDAFVRKAKEVLEENLDSKYAICCGDINKYKVINDLYGTKIGDKVLVHIVNTLKATFGEEAIYSSQGSGLFSIMFEFTMENFEKLRNIKYFDCKELGIDFPVTMRFGIYVATVNDNPDSVFDMMNYATLSMDLSKTSIKNEYTVFSEELQKQMKQEVIITQQMPEALDNGEFVLYFQPQYHIASGKLVGAETLCRWIKPGGKIISPTEFIPIAEKNGFIRILDKYIWDAAFSTIRKWLDAGVEPVPISINISRISLQSGGVIGIIEHLRKQYDIPENLVHFEITESACMDDKDDMIRQVKDIQTMGYQIAMDDFGSGYSSLNTLKDISIDILKLDMGFLQESENMEKGSNIISNIVRMAQSLNLTTIAEGIETEDQAKFLKNLGCDIIQGFLYAKPMPESDFFRILKNGEVMKIVEKPKVMGLIDVNRFNRPDSIENMMFENYTGAAAIVEYDAGADRVSLVRANTRCVALFGLDDKSISEVNINFEKYFRSDETFVDAIRKACNEEETNCVTKNKNFKTQLPVWIKSNIRRLSVLGEKYTLFILTADITEEKITETTLSLSNNQMSLIMEKSMVGMCLLNIECDFKNPFETIKMRFLKVNPQFSEISGYPVEEVLNWTEKEVFGIIHPFDMPGFATKIAGAFLNRYRKPFSYVYRAKHKDGSWKRVKILITGIEQSKRSYLVITNYILMDINSDDPKEKTRKNPFFLR